MQCLFFVVNEHASQPLLEMVQEFTTHGALGVDYVTAFSGDMERHLLVMPNNYRCDRVFTAWLLMFTTGMLRWVDFN